MGHASIVSLLLAAGADVNQMDVHGRNPLASAARQGHTDVVGLLLEAGADIDNQPGASWGPRDARGNTPLDLAVMQRDVKIITMIARMLQQQRGPPEAGQSSARCACRPVGTLTKLGIDDASLVLR